MKQTQIINIPVGAFCLKDWWETRLSFEITKFYDGYKMDKTKEGKSKRNDEITPRCKAQSNLSGSLKIFNPDTYVLELDKNK